MFRKKAKEKIFTLPQKTENQLLSVPGPWDVSFQPGRGAPDKIILDNLVSWTEISDPGVKYFSGTGTYTRTIKAEEIWLNSGNRIWIDLGELKNLAEVVINGQSAGIVWKTPFRLEITNLLKPGDNTLEIKVTNLWVNRLIGDAQPGVIKKYTYTAIPFYDVGYPLLTSGLLGPVRIMSLEEK